MKLLLAANCSLARYTRNCYQTLSASTSLAGCAPVILSFPTSSNMRDQFWNAHMLMMKDARLAALDCSGQCHLA